MQKLFMMQQEQSRQQQQSIKRPKLDMTPHPGYKLGLQVVLDMESHKAFTPRSNPSIYKGFKVAVTSRNDGLSVAESGFLVPPGHLTYVAISASKVDVEPSLRDINAQDRQCYFDDEYDLNVFKKYSQTRCLIECNLLPAFDKFGCMPWTVPGPTDQICDPYVADQ